MGDDDHERRPDSLLNKFWHPAPRPPAFGKGKIIPQIYAGCVCRVPCAVFRSILNLVTQTTFFVFYQAVVADCTLMALAADHGGLYEAPRKRWYVAGIFFELLQSI